MATPKQAHALVTYYAKQYAKKYGRQPNVNRYKARYGFDSVLTGMDSDEAQSLIDFYLSTASSNSHDLVWFFYNYEKLVESKLASDQDSESLERIRSESQRRAEEWRKKRNND